MSDTTESNKKLKDKVLTIAGIIISLLIVIICAGIIKKTSAKITCGRKLAGLSTAMMIYTNHHDQFPAPEKWCDLLIEDYDAIPSDFRCPGVKEGPCNYALNKNIAELGKSEQVDIVLLFETHPGWNQVGGPEILTTENHNGEGCNVAFIDSHVEFVKTKNIKKLKWKPD